MADWVQYDKSEELKWSARGRGPCRIFWGKNVRLPPDSRIWLIASRKGKPKLQYFLYESFVPTKIGEGEASGSGVLYGDSIRLDTRPWFAEFRLYMGNFGRGLSPLPPEWSNRLRQAAGEATASKGS